MSAPTKAQQELLVWLASAPDAEYSGGSLITYYRQREIAKRRAAGSPWPEHARGGYADHGWRRSGGLQLRRLADKGLMRQVRWVWGVPQYILTTAGIEAARHAADNGVTVPGTRAEEDADA